MREPNRVAKWCAYVSAHGRANTTAGCGAHA